MSIVNEDIVAVDRLVMLEKNVKRYFNFCSERHAIYLRRAEGQPWPWTEDEILKTYKFTNIFRELDTGTIWYKENIREPYADDEELFFNTCMYRQFNYWPTADEIGYISTYKPQKLERKLRARKERGDKIFTSAHMITGTLGGDKITQVVHKVLFPLWEHRKDLQPQQGDTLESAYMRFKNPGFGPFIRYEVITDLRHTRYLENASDIMTWANAGPGAKRGIMRLCGIRPYTAKAGAPSFKMSGKPEFWNAFMQELLHASDKYLKDFMPAMEMRDIEHSLCEWDKWERARTGQGKPRQRYTPSAQV
jgi:hypothetical protein